MTAPAGPAAVLWDMDGTLVDSERLWDVSLAELTRHLGGTLSRATRERMVGMSLETSVRMAFAEAGRDPDASSLVGAGEWLMTRTGELFAAELDWCPGALDAVRAVRADGWATALVTSTHRKLAERALDRIGRQHFDVVVCGDEVPATKPAPDPYLRAAALLEVAARDCVAVEDSPAGSASALAAGCAVIVVAGAGAGGPGCWAARPGPADPGPAGTGADGPVRRSGLVGLTPAELRAVWRGSHTGDHWSRQTAHSAAPGASG
jgi:HAD superfamily hydrolase (TIGR01509 family)